MTGIKMTHVPYKGTNEAIADLLTGRLTVLFSPLPVVRERMKVAGGEPKVLTGDAFRKFIESEIETWAKVVKYTGLALN